MDRGTGTGTRNVIFQKRWNERVIPLLKLCKDRWNVPSFSETVYPIWGTCLVLLVWLPEFCSFFSIESRARWQMASTLRCREQQWREKSEVPRTRNLAMFHVPFDYSKYSTWKKNPEIISPQPTVKLNITALKQISNSNHSFSYTNFSTIPHF